MEQPNEAEHEFFTRRTEWQWRRRRPSPCMHGQVSEGGQRSRWLHGSTGFCASMVTPGGEKRCISRYRVDMSQLSIFSSDSNRSWFEDPKADWHDSVFG